MSIAAVAMSTLVKPIENSVISTSAQIGGKTVTNLVNDGKGWDMLKNVAEKAGKNILEKAVGSLEKAAVKVLDYLEKKFMSWISSWGTPAS
ncbi:hypothetical protein SK355_04730 [Candidatus Fukatsuia symbiotica]|uniref:Uncharacterized protein n=1 Tax=Candidatus Fukatsuia symbiotica TaxID=1878942 RepID=A0A2U8I5B0_9GAMM|nr:hypothetical protein [Candidatus Fukatsuia symbiotica]AWK14337.1 hypothetical protein CCS41_07405 [Candidatus Fukatsuia symbiotica]MEA9444598.1 hypothetical protein [Candidatus Fukatsuia symbiotica]